MSGGGSGSGSETSLFRALAPGARTDAGRSLLRALLLQPLAHAPTIAARHEAVAELASEAATTTVSVAAATGGGSNGENNGGGGGAGGAGRFGVVSTAGPRGDSVSRALHSLPRDLDRALGILSLRPCRYAGGGGGGGNGNGRDLDSPLLDSAKAAAAAASRVDRLARGLGTLRLTLSALPALAASLEGCSASLLAAVRANVSHPTFAGLARALGRVLEHDPLGGSAAALRGGGEAGEGFEDDDGEGKEEEEEGERGGCEEDDEGEGAGDFDDDDDARTQATASCSARPPLRRGHRTAATTTNSNGNGNNTSNSNGGQARSRSTKRVALPRPPEPTRSAYAVRAERGGLLEAARGALSASAAGAAAEAWAVRELGRAGGRRRGGGGGGGSGSGGSGSLSQAWRACLSRAKLAHTARKGFVVVLPRAPSAASSCPTSAPAAPSASASAPGRFLLPAGLSLVSVRPRGGALEVSTPALAALNARAAAALADCLLLSEQALEAAAAACLEHADFLHRLADNVALVDALSAFAVWARGVRSRRRGGGGAGAAGPAVAVPRLVGPREPLALGGLRCAQLESGTASGGAEVVPNDVYLADRKSVV